VYAIIPQGTTKPLELRKPQMEHAFSFDSPVWFSYKDSVKPFCNPERKNGGLHLILK
jgi:hypothetical protein